MKCSEYHKQMCANMSAFFSSDQRKRNEKRVDTQIGQ